MWDLPDASFAGQQETYLNVRGESQLLDACRRCFASLFTDRAISYRVHHGFDHLQVALSIGIQQMVRSDLGTSGVMFSIDTESGFCDAVLINAAYGLGENVVQGSINPDEYYGAAYEPKEENPMIGFRGASRHYDERYRRGFALECQAVKKVRDEMGLKNLQLMVPFCRTPDEGRRVLAEMESHQDRIREAASS